MDVHKDGSALVRAGLVVPAGMTVEYANAVGGPVYDYFDHAVQRYLVVPDGEMGSWTVFGRNFRTVAECREYVDNKLAGYAKERAREEAERGLRVICMPHDILD